MGRHLARLDWREERGMNMKALYGLVVSSLFALVRTLIAIGVAVFFVEGRYLASLGAFALYVFTTGLLEVSLAPYLARPISNRNKPEHLS